MSWKKAFQISNLNLTPLIIDFKHGTYSSRIFSSFIKRDGTISPDCCDDQLKQWWDVRYCFSGFQGCHSHSQLHSHPLIRHAHPHTHSHSHTLRMWLWDSNASNLAKFRAFPAFGLMESAVCEEEDLEDLGWGGGALRKRPVGKGRCGGEKKFKKRTDMFLFIYFFFVLFLFFFF